MATLSPRLGDQQAFILAWLVMQPNERPSHSRPRHRSDGQLSWAVALEFDGYDGERILPADRAEATYHRKDEILSDAHRASLSRSLGRLEERGLIERSAMYYHPRRIELTTDGRRVGREVLRRHRDGRYSLEFNTLD